MRRLLAPRAAIALAAVLVAAASGGSATAAARCGAGTVKGIALVTGGRSGGGSIPGTYTSAAALFGYRWNCSRGTISVRRPDTSPPGFDVRFVGNPSKVAVAGVVAGEPASASVTRNPDGSFHVTIAGQSSGNGFPIRQDLPFVVIAL
jgi:hypothetical protein